MSSLKRLFLEILFSLFYYFWLLYDFLKSKLISCHTYSRLSSRIKSLNFSKMHQILSMGFGDCYAFSSIFSHSPSSLKILNHNIGFFKLFRFKKREGLEVIEKVDQGTRFDAVFFTSSTFAFAKLEQQIQQAKKMLKRNGKIFFVVSLFKKKSKILKSLRSFFCNLWESGNQALMTEKEFLAMLKRNGLDINYKERIKENRNPFFTFFRFFLIEVQV